MRSPLMITPPSWMALLGKKIVSSISGVASQSTGMPDSTASWSWMDCSMAMSAPMRTSARRSTVWMMTSMFSRCSCAVAKSGRLPNSASIRRSSGWKITSTASTKKAEKPPRKYCSTLSFSR